MTAASMRKGAARRWAILLGSASLFSMAGAMGAQAQQAAPLIAAEAAATAVDAATPGAVEEVVVTGSHIRGVQSVGVPVTTLTDKEFKESGAVTVADLFINLPSVVMIADSNVINGGGYVARDQNINIRNLSQKGTRTLMMVDGMRFPNQGNGGCQTDPSIIPQLAIDHVDLLTDGASAVYGSDAVAGVVNVVLKRGFQGLITQAQYGQSNDLGNRRKTFSFVAGKKWELAGKEGGVTVSAEYYDQDGVVGPGRSYFTANYAPYGYDNRMSILNARPAIVTIGAATAAPGLPSGFSATLGTSCALTSCFSVPSGQNGVGLTWAQILAHPGVGNEINNFSDGWIQPSAKRVAATATFDQELTPDVRVFADGWFSNRHSTMHSQASGLNLAVPTSNPYYPIGAPTGLQANYDLTRENPIIVQTKELASRLDAGFDFNLPLKWKAKLTAAISDIHEWNDTNGTINKNNALAALGNTVAGVAATATTPAITAYTKPANIPYLNVFCDSNTIRSCNDPATLAYISGFNDANEEEVVRELNFTADGPLFHVPGGDVKGAVGGLYTATTYSNYGFATNGNTTQVFNNTSATGARYVGSAFAQVNIPLFGPEFNIPFARKVNLELAVRYDHYNQFGSTTNPKASLDWNIGYGLTFKTSIGTSFRAPSFQENANGGPGAINSVLGTGAANSVGTCPVVGQKAVAGSIAALIDPNCTAALQFLGGLSLLNSAQSAAAIRPGGVNLTPEKGENFNFGFEFAPRPDDGVFGFLSGLDLQATYWRLRITDKLQGYFGLASTQTGQLDDPNYTAAFLTAANDPLFAQHVAALVNSNQSSLPASVIPNVSFISDGAIRNIGWQYVDGIDLQADYRWHMTGIGGFNTGITGTYNNKNVSNGGPGQSDINYYTLNRDGRFRWRSHLGWVQEPTKGAGFGVTAFVNYLPHYTPLTNPLPPACFLAGNSACNASGNAAYSSYSQQYASLAPSQYVKDVYTTDISISYNTGDLPKNDYLKHVRLQLTINNLFNKAPPFQYSVSPPGGGAPHAFYTSTASSELSIDGRVFNFSVTKEW